MAEQTGTDPRRVDGQLNALWKRDPARLNGEAFADGHAAGFEDGIAWALEHMQGDAERTWKWERRWELQKGR